MAMGHGHVGTEHLLLALLSEEKGIAACILGDAKVTCDDVRNAISSQSHAVPSRVVRWSRLDFSNLDERTKKAFGLSRQEALRMKQDQIDTEHLLLGLMGAGGMVLDALEKLEVDPGRLRDAIERRVPPGRAEGTHGALPFTQGAKQVLELALDEAELLGHDNIDGGHLLVGLMKEEKGVAAQVLRTAGVSLESARQALGREKRS
jgi:ATP-dependent Clp protease ATP-binding subunit ClpA